MSGSDCSYGHALSKRQTLTYTYEAYVNLWQRRQDPTRAHDIL